MQKFGWGVAALITPVTLLVTGAMFFSLNLFPAFFAPITAKIGTTPLMLAVMVGAAQNILSKGKKSSILRTTVIFIICSESSLKDDALLYRPLRISLHFISLHCISSHCNSYFFSLRSQIFTFRPLQGDGLHSSRPGVQDKRKSSSGCYRKPSWKIRVSCGFSQFNLWYRTHLITW